MREILFRGKRIDNGEWVYGKPWQYDPKTARYVHAYEAVIITAAEYLLGSCDKELYCEACAVDPKTVGQYTGLTDKNGAKIFEGDVIRMNNGKNDIAVIKYGEFGCMDVELEMATDTVIGWYYEPVPKDAMSKMEPFCLPFQINDFWAKKLGYEVIGNIYDNPELLEAIE